ncbi:sensor histidine kinase [Microbispora sp. NPDC049125]|uniref:sensor histidine kinase n=1 Tax=Microbispora sp. NPDC049125 TaxID=3154929 RepID=UPI003465796D
MTLLVACLSVLLLVPAGILTAALARQRLAGMEWRNARRQADITAADVRTGRSQGLIVPQVSGADLVQVVSSDHRVLASSAAARTLPPLTSKWPTPQEPRQDVQTCSTPQVGCVRLAAVLAWAARGSPAVFAGSRVPGLVSTSMFDAFFAIQVTGLIALATWTTWRVTGRTLRPVEAIRAQLALINADDRSSLVPEPPGDDEIARLARTINTTMGRLDRARRSLEGMLSRQRQFASDASHELWTPIAGLRTQLEEAQLHPDESDMSVVLAGALGDVDRLESIASDLLLLARLGAHPPEALVRIDLAELVRGELLRLSPASRAAQAPRIQPCLHPGVFVYAVPDHIRRALGNLLDNARRHAKRDIWVHVRSTANSAELTVDDDGEGIAATDRETVFLRFTRLDTARSRDHGGTGLGLAIAREIAQAHHGSMSVDEGIAGGARFVLRIPLAQPGWEPRETAEAPPETA